MNISPRCRNWTFVCIVQTLKTSHVVFIFRWGQSFVHPSHAYTPIPLILFPVPLALRWYLRSSVFIIVCLCLPAQTPPFSSDSNSLPPPSSDTVTLTLTHAHACAHTNTSPPHTPPASWRCLIHFCTPSTHWLQLEAGGAGLDIYLQEQATSYTQTGPTCSANHKQEDSEAGSRSTNIYPGA